MAGPVTMALGPFMFRAHGFGYSDVGRNLNTPWAELKTVGRPDALQWTGPTSETVKISGVLFPEEFGGLGTLEGLRLAARNGIPLFLVSLGGGIFGRQAIQRIEEERKYHTRRGLPRKNSYSIEVRKLGSGLSLSSLFGI